MFTIMIFVVLSLYAGRARKLNIGVNIFSGLYARQRRRQANVIAAHIPIAFGTRAGCKTVIPGS